MLLANLFIVELFALVNVFNYILLRSCDLSYTCLQAIHYSTEPTITVSKAELTPLLKRKAKRVGSVSLKKSNSFHVSVATVAHGACVTVFGHVTAHRRCILLISVTPQLITVTLQLTRAQCSHMTPNTCSLNTITTWQLNNSTIKVFIKICHAFY